MGGYHKKFPAPIVATLVLLDRLIEWKKYQAPSISRYMINDPESNGWSLSSQSYSSLTNILLIVIQSRFNRSDPPVDLVVQHFGKYYLGEGRFVCEGGRKNTRIRIGSILFIDYCSMFSMRDLSWFLFQFLYALTPRERISNIKDTSGNLRPGCRGRPIICRRVRQKNWRQPCKRWRPFIKQLQISSVFCRSLIDLSRCKRD